MIIKSHLCGIAIAYEPRTIRKSDEVKPLPYRVNGSRYSRQKRAIADAVEYMRLNPTRPGCKPLIFVATSPGYTNAANESSLISKLTHNLRNGYNVKRYIWVRELTKKGYPHFHFVADTEYIDAKKISLYWSSLFGSDAANSVRLGTKPIPGRKRVYHIQNSRMAFYFGKYFGKGIGYETPVIPSTSWIYCAVCYAEWNRYQDGERKRKPRLFAISVGLAKLSQPLVFHEEITTLFNNTHQRRFVLTEEEQNKFYEISEIPPVFNPRSIDWSWTGHGQTYIGSPKKWRKKKTNLPVKVNR